MDAKKRQQMIRLINEMDRNAEFARKLGLEDVSMFRGRHVKREKEK